MTDGPDRLIGKRNFSTETSVSELASRAIAELASKRSSGRPPVSERLVAQLTEAACSLGDEAVRGAITDIRHSGISTEEILDFYIPESARRLGDAWCDDKLGFAEVSIGSARLQRALRALATDPRDADFAPHDSHSLLVAALGTEAHTLGAMTLTEQFRRRGLSVRLLLGEPESRIIRTVAEGQFDAILLSAAVIETLADLRGLIKKLRSSAGGKIPILVGGTVCGTGTDVKKLTGADYTTSDVNEALRLCGLTGALKGARLRATSE